MVIGTQKNSKGCPEDSMCDGSKIIGQAEEFNMQPETDAISWLNVLSILGNLIPRFQPSCCLSGRLPYLCASMLKKIFPSTFTKFICRIDRYSMHSSLRGLILTLLFAMLLGCFSSSTSPSVASTETSEHLEHSYTISRELHLVLVLGLSLPSSQLSRLRSM